MMKTSAHRIAVLLSALLAIPAAATAAAPARLTLVPDTAVTTLLFHQVSADPIVGRAGGEDGVKKPWTTPAEFDAILSDAERSGYHFVTVDQAEKYLRGTLDASALPTKPMLLTFDDGYASAFTDGTPVLRKHHATAIMFFEGILTDTKAGRLTTPQLRAMLASGVWELQSHGFKGHSNIVVDAAGTRTPYWYANLAWLPDKARLETASEFEARVREDLHTFRATFEPKLGIRIHMFAYPSGEFGQNDALQAGGDPLTKLEAGHSNARGLTPLLFDALQKEGYEMAFSVSIPGDTVGAERANSLFAIPRLGAGAGFTFTSVDKLATAGTILPEIVHDRFTSPGPLAIFGSGRLLLASTQQPNLFELGPDGRLDAQWEIPELLSDRRTFPTLISAVIPEDDGTASVVQQAGWWPNATPQVTRVKLAASGTATVISRTALPSALNWLVGVTSYGGKRIGMTDSGDLLTFPAGIRLGSIALETKATERQNRFAGPFLSSGALTVYDRTARELLTIDERGAVLAHSSLDGDLRNFTSLGDKLYAVDFANKRHILMQYRVSN